METAVDTLDSMLTDANSWPHFLPETRQARRDGFVGGDPLVSVVSESVLFDAPAYTLRVHREKNTVRFWMDPSKKHDIRDVWGFFRAEPLADGKTLVTFGILIDMGDGLLRDLFEKRVREVALEIPDRVKHELADRNTRGVRVSAPSVVESDPRELVSRTRVLPRPRCFSALLLASFPGAPSAPPTAAVPLGLSCGFTAAKREIPHGTGPRQLVMGSLI